jgi:esterase
VLLPKISDYATRQFILKNIYWKEDSRLDFRFNLTVISKNIEKVGEACFEYGICLVPTLFIRGGKSNYITNRDIDDIHQKFTTVDVITIDNAGHWVHAEAPEVFFQEANAFLSDKY